MTKDLTQGSPARLILFFTIPLLLGNIFQQFYSMADTIIVGRTIGVNALAAVGATGCLSFLIIGFIQGMTSGLAVITAQRFGAGDEAGVRKSVAASLLIGASVALVLTLFSSLFAYQMLEWMHTPAEIIDDAYSYIVVIFMGTGATMLFNLLSNIIRALGDSKTPLYFLVIASIINVGLDFLFILKFNMGVAGAGWATVASQVVSGGLCVLYMIKKLPFLRFHKEDWKIEGHVFAVHLKVGLPMGFQFSIIAIGTMILQMALNNLGSTAVAAFTAAQKIDNLATQPLASFGVTIATFVAQNYGAGRMDRVHQGVRQCTIMSLIISVIGGVAIILGGNVLVRLFVGAGESEVIQKAQIYLVINGSMYFILALLFVYRNAIQGLGKSLVPTIAGIMELVMRTFAAVILADMIQFPGVCMANPIAWLGAVVPVMAAYFVIMRKYKQKSVLIQE